MIQGTRIASFFARAKTPTELVGRLYYTGSFLSSSSWSGLNRAESQAVRPCGLLSLKIDKPSCEKAVAKSQKSQRGAHPWRLPAGSPDNAILSGFPLP